MIHTVAWVGWLGSALVTLSVTRNPLYLSLAILCMAIVNATVRSSRRAFGESVTPLRFAVAIVPLTALFNAATAHFGDTVLFRLPGWLPVLGGPITLEALVFGMGSGLVLSGFLMAFATLNQALPVRSLIRLIPQAFYPIAVVIAISVAYVPTTLRCLRQIRDAQAVRGHRVRGLRDWLPLLMPLLVGGLERALRLAEAMTARGFASSGAHGERAVARSAVATGLLALLAGLLLRLVWGRYELGLGLMLAGGALVGGAVWHEGRQNPRTTYRPETWSGRDCVVALGAAVAMAVLFVPALDRGSLAYSPYPALALPGFDPIIAAGTLGLLGPVALPARN